jgi:hypothetical protein
MVIPRVPLLVISALAIGGPACAQSRPASEAIGSWVLSCPDAKAVPCQLRNRMPIIQASDNGPAASLEVAHRGDRFVPVVALRGMSMQAAVGGMLAVQGSVTLRFDNASAIELGCGLDGSAVVCAPSGAAAATAAAALPDAHNVVVRVRMTLPGAMALPEQSRSLDLQETGQALAQFRATAPASESVPVIAGLDWRGFLDRMARDAGFRNGLADVLSSGRTLIDGRPP